jgi:hypothetical protein
MKYRNTMLLILSLVLLLLFADSQVVQTLIMQIGSYGYFGAMVVGVFFVSIFTVAPASLVLIELSDTLNPYALALCAGAGGVLGDLFILHFLEYGIGFVPIIPDSRLVGYAPLADVVIIEQIHMDGSTTGFAISIVFTETPIANA